MLALAGCAAQPLLRSDPSAPPAILMPASLAGVRDLRAQYRATLCAIAPRDCDVMLHRLAGEAITATPAPATPPGRLRLAIVPGYGADCFSGFVTVLGDARATLEAQGWLVEEFRIEGLSSTTRNAALIRDQLMAANLAPGERFVLLGYSKGMADLLEALARHPEIRPRVAAAVGLAGTVMGSPLADDPPRLLPALASNLPGAGCTAGDGGAFESLRRTTRLAFLAQFGAGGFGVPLYSLGAFAARDRTSRVLRGMHDRLSAIDPRNDSQTLFTDQVVPGSALLGYLDADHWAVGLPLDTAQPLLAALFTEHNAFPRAAMLEALLRVVIADRAAHRP
jgi:hypothetical protein